MNITALSPTHQRHYFGTAEVLAEDTVHPKLRIAPDVDLVGQGRSHRLRYTGSWKLIHLPTGYQVGAEHGMPLPWLRRFARLLAESGIDWDRVEGDTRLVRHPQHASVSEVEWRVLDCWLRGVPVDPLQDSLRSRHGLLQLVCANTSCEDDVAPGEPLSGGEDGGDEVAVEPPEVDALFEIARHSGWQHLAENRWLCEGCRVTHEPAPARTAAWLTRVRTRAAS